MEQYHKEEYHFRIVGLSVHMRDELKDCFPGASFTEGTHWQTKEPVLTLQLEQKASYRDLVEFVSTKSIRPGTYGIYISLVTNMDQDGIHVPPFIVDLLRELGGTLDFSFVSILDEQ